MSAPDRRQRRRRRLTILVLGFFLLIAGVAGLWFVQQSRQTAYLADLREQGMAAYEAGDNAYAAAKLEEYLRQDEDHNAEALFAAADAVMRVPQSGNLHLAKARQWLLRLRVVDPSHESGRDLILELADLYLPPSDAIAIANDVLAGDPDHAEALRIRGLKSARIDNFEDAERDFAAYLDSNPDDYETQLLLLQVRNELHVDPEELITQAKLLVEENENDPRYEMVLGLTYAMANQTEDARTWVRSAATRDVPSDEFIQSLTNAFDRLGLFGEASEYLVKVSADRPIDGALGLEVSRRLFEAGQFDAVLQRIDVDANDVATESLAIRAMTLFERGQRDEAQAALGELRGHPEVSGKLWADVLEAFYAQPRVVASAIEIGERTMAEGLVHPYVLFMLGNLHAGIDDHTASISYQEQASRVRPSWAAPLLFAARDYLALDQWHIAEQMSRQASVRRPDLIDAHVVRALAMGNNPQAVRTGQVDEVLAYMDRILERAPRNEPLRVMKVRLLAANGDLQDAAAFAGETIRLDPPASGETLMELAEIAREYRLGFEAAAMARVKSAYGDTPALVYAQAVELADAGDPDAGRKLIADAAQSDPDSLAWRFANAQFLSHLGDPEATLAYADLAASYPDSLDLQVQIMRSPAVRADRELSDQLIERVRELAGEQSTQWRVERARWHLTGPNPADEAEAAETLLSQAIDGNPGDADAYLLRARAKELQGRLAQAVVDAKSAQNIRPDAPGVLLELVRFEQAVGNFPAALGHLKRIADNPSADAAQLRQTAAMLAGQGEYADATGLLESLQNRSGFGTADRLLLARLYAQSGQLRESKWQVEQLLDESSSLETISFAADFYAQLGELDNARAVLDRLDELALTDSERSAVRADFASRYESGDQAAQYFVDAAEADPTNPTGWLRLSAFHLSRADTRTALAAARRGLQEVGPEPGLEALLRRGDAIGELLSDDPSLAPLIAALLGGDGFRDAADTAVRFLADARSNQASPTEVVTGLRRLADDHPRFLALQLVTAERLLRAGLPEQARDIAGRAARSFPGSVDAARLQTVAFSADQLWDQALSAAREWRKRGARNPLAADIAIARAQLRLGRTQDASETLGLHLPAVETNASGGGAYAEVLGEALIRQNRITEARNLIQPRLREHGDWRMAWIRLASQHLEDPQTRRVWLETVTPLVPAEARAERFTLAEAWWSLHLASPETPGDRIAGQILEALVADPDASAVTWFMHGVVTESAGRMDVAADAYRQVLRLNPDAQIARNNLAMLLIDRSVENDGVEALDLARTVVASNPNNANYRDTLAYVQAKLGDLDEAIAQIQIAIDLEPQNPLWRERLAELLKQSGGGNNTTPVAGVGAQ
ncbi:MAG: tetratricopeptide repeat protein [Planctomycetota bacterium]